MPTPSKSFVILNIGALCTLEQLTKRNQHHAVTMDDLSVVELAWMVVEDGKVAAYGTGSVPTSFASLPKVDAHKGLVLPGFVDCHTHPIFAGSRSNEFLMRMNGASYQEIAEAGGGISSSMRSTREASNELLVQHTADNFRRFLSHGVTTVEAKSGYGLSLPEELRMLALLKAAASKTPQTISITCLALHAKSPEFPDYKSYADACKDHLLPKIKEEGLADAVDAFIEKGYFSVEDTRPFFQKAKDLGIAIRLHADEFSDAGGGAFAAELGAKSADHLQFVSDQGLQAMAKAGVVATILPGTSLYTAIPFTNGKRIIDAGVALAVATDFNPGSCVIDNISLIATTAAIQCKVPPAAVLAGITYVPACSLGLGERKGALTTGFDADFTIWNHQNFAAWLADFGREKPKTVFIRGEEVTFNN